MKRKVFDRVLLAISFLALAGPALFLSFYWGQMPESIPTHFNDAGQIDVWGKKSTILILPILSVILFGMLQFAAVICASMKNTGGVRPMLAMETMCRILSAFVAIVFAYLTVCSALAVPLGRWFVPVFIVTMAVSAVACIIWACIPKRK